MNRRVFLAAALASLSKRRCFSTGLRGTHLRAPPQRRPAVALAELPDVLEESSASTTSVTVTSSSAMFVGSSRYENKLSRVAAQQQSPSSPSPTRARSSCRTSSPTASEGCSSSLDQLINTERDVARWFRNSPTVGGIGSAVHADPFGPNTGQRREDRRVQARYRAAAAARGEKLPAKSTTSSVPSSEVAVPLLPVNYLRRRSYVAANGDVDGSTGDSFATDTEERLQQERQRMHLQQLSTEEPFRCRRCGNISFEVPRSVVGRGTFHDPRGAQSQCERCRAPPHNKQWLMDYAHRKENAAASAAPTNGGAQLNARVGLPGVYDDGDDDTSKGANADVVPAPHVFLKMRRKSRSLSNQSKSAGAACMRRVSRADRQRKTTLALW